MRSAHTSKGKRSFRPSVEMLEVREVLSTYYVATNGNNSNNGSSADPFATIQQAANVVKAGDTVIIEAGTYAGFDVQTSGTASAPITYEAASGAKVVIDSPEANRGDCGINIEDWNHGDAMDYITIEGLDINNADSKLNFGIRAVWNGNVNSTGIDLIDNTVTNCDEFGIFTSHEDNVLVEGNSISGTKGTNGNGHGIYISNACFDPHIIGNTIFDNQTLGLHMNGDASEGAAVEPDGTSDGNNGNIVGAVVEDNIIYGNGVNGINCDGLQNSVIENNLLYNNGGGIVLYQTDAAAPATNNVIANNTVTVLNTDDFGNEGRWDIQIMDGSSTGSTGNTVFNNILINQSSINGAIEIGPMSLSGFHSNDNVITTSGDGGSASSHAFDLVDSSGNDHFVSLATWRSDTGQDTNSLTATSAQLFSDPSWTSAGGNYQLLSTSPATTAGVASLNGVSAPSTDILGNPRNSAYSIGAYEYQSTTGSSKPPTVTTPAAASPGTVTGTTTNLGVQASDPNGDALTYTWAETSGPSGVTFNANGTGSSNDTTATFTQAGSYSFTVTVKDTAGLTATSSVNVTVNQTLGSIAVSPASASVAVKATQQYAATARDQFGNAMSTQPSFTWSLSGGGTISSSGLFTASTIGGPYTVTASSGGKSGTAGVSVTSTTTTSTSVDINAGGGASGSFLADGDFSGGSTYSTTAAINTSKVTNPAPQSVYQTERYGNLTYTIPNLTPGASYTVRLDFAELYFNSAGSRVFDVSINGQQVLTNFDIYATAGGKDIAIAETFTATANSSGQIVMQFTSVVNNAKVDGIEITPNQTTPPTPTQSVSVDAGGPAAGSFQADAYYSGGSTYSTTAAINTSGVTNPAPQSVYDTERYGNFTYTIPNLTPGASYTVRLDFAEIYFDSAGSRVFNVSINGQQVLTNFDIFATAGGMDKAIAETFTATANSSGQIVIGFTSVVNNAKVSGIEITPN